MKSAVVHVPCGLIDSCSNNSNNLANENGTSCNCNCHFWKTIWPVTESGKIEDIQICLDQQVIKPFYRGTRPNMYCCFNDIDRLHHICNFLFSFLSHFEGTFEANKGQGLGQTIKLPKRLTMVPFT